MQANVCSFGDTPQGTGSGSRRSGSQGLGGGGGDGGGGGGDSSSEEEAVYEDTTEQSSASVSGMALRELAYDVWAWAHNLGCSSIQQNQANLFMMQAS